MKPKSFHCDVVLAIFFAGVIGLLVGASTNEPKPETCIFDPVFNRWECCVNTTQTTRGPQCAAGQPVRLLNN